MKLLRFLFLICAMHSFGVDGKTNDDNFTLNKLKKDYQECYLNKDKNDCEKISLQIKNNNEQLYKRIDSLASLVANLKDHKIPGGLDTVTKPKPIPQFTSEFNTFHDFELNGSQKYISIARKYLLK